MAAKPGSLRFFAEKYSVSHVTIKSLKGEGLDLTDEAAVNARLNLAAPSALPRSVPTSTDGSGIKAAIARLQSAEQALHADYSAALIAGDKSASVRLKEWTSVVEQLRKVEGDATTIEEEQGNSISKHELAGALGSLFSNLRLDLDSLARRVSAECERKGRFDIEAVISRETTRIVGNLYACSYLEGGQDE